MDRARLELLLAAIDAGIQTAKTTAAQLQVARDVVAGELLDGEDAPRCPECKSEDLAPAGDEMVCGECGANVPVPVANEE